jgi:hypothetical protein
MADGTLIAGVGNLLNYQETSSTASFVFVWSRERGHFGFKTSTTGGENKTVCCHETWVTV